MTRVVPRLIVLGMVLCSHYVVLGSSICVKVVDVIDAPLAQATVRIERLSNQLGSYAATTDSKGTACTGHLPEGLYSVEVSLVGFLNVRYYPVRVAFPEDV